MKIRGREDSKLLYEEGEKCYKKSDYEQAIQYFQRALESDPEHTDALYRLAFAYFGNKNLREASKTWFKLGLVEFEKKKFHQARKAFRRAAHWGEHFPGLLDWSNWVYLGLSNFQVNRIEPALESFKKAIPLAPKDDLWMLYWFVGICFYRIKEYPQAIEFFKKASEQYDNFKACNLEGVFLYHLGHAYFENQQYTDAVKTLRQALKFEDSERSSRWWLRQAEEALNLEKTVSVSPHIAEMKSKDDVIFLFRQGYLPIEDAFNQLLVFGTSNQELLQWIEEEYSRGLDSYSYTRIFKQIQIRQRLGTEYKGWKFTSTIDADEETALAAEKTISLEHGELWIPSDPKKVARTIINDFKDDLRRNQILFFSEKMNDSWNKTILMQIAALYYWVRDQIVYLTGNGRQTPGRTIEVGGGQCLEQADLLTTLIRSLGINSHILVTEDHAVVGVELPEIPKELLESIYQFEKTKLLILDPTCSYCDFGQLPEQLLQDIHLMKVLGAFRLSPNQRIDKNLIDADKLLQSGDYDSAVNKAWLAFEYELRERLSIINPAFKGDAYLLKIYDLMNMVQPKLLENCGRTMIERLARIQRIRKPAIFAMVEPLTKDEAYEFVITVKELIERIRGTFNEKS